MLKIARPVSFLLLSAALCSSGTVFAANETATPKVGISQQQKSLKGTVNDVLGPVAGASVVVKGTTNGTVTDMDGNFVLEVNNGDVLQISFIGYVTQEIKYTGQATLTVNLMEDTQKLEEVVVVGYGTQKKVNMTGAVAQIDSKALENRPVQNVSTALQGTMPGVQVTSGGGRPGQDGGTIRVRGVGTLNTADPYILVDGIETGTMNSVDPNDIESISVLKDAASAAIYGSKASNGVILITTKRGKTGKPRISYNGYVGFQKPTEMIDRISSYDYARLYSQSMIDEGLNPRFNETDIENFRNGTSPNTDWYDEAYRTGVQHSHNVSVSGGTENAKYMGSVGYLGQTGILPNADRQQFNARTNLDLKLNSRLTVRLNLAYIKNDYSDPISSYASGISETGDPNSAASSDQIIRQLNRIAPWIVGRAEDGTYGTIGDGNPLAWLDVNQTVDRKNQNFSGTLSADYKIIDGLVATVTGSYVNNQQHYRAFQKYIQYNPNKETEPNRLEERFTGWHRANFDALLNFDRQFGEHGLKAMAGWHTEKYDYTYNQQFRKNFPTNDLTDIAAGDAATQKNNGYTRELAMISWFGRINYDYAGKYLLEGNIRSDASSRFADGNRWGYFPSFSAAWRISEEGFMKNLGFVDNLKLRASWGQTGNERIDAFMYLPQYNTSNVVMNGSLVSAVYQKKMANPDVTWETVEQTNIGLDFGFLNNTIYGELDWYSKDTKDILLALGIPHFIGLDAPEQNAGVVRNSGVEAMVGFRKTFGEFTFNTSFNLAYNKNEWIDRGGDDKNISGYNIQTIGSPLNAFYIYQADGLIANEQELEEYRAKYKSDPRGMSDLHAGDVKLVDTNNDGTIDPDDRQIFASNIPKFTYGWNISGEYKGFDLSLLFQGSSGANRMMYGEWIEGPSYEAFTGVHFRDRWTEENQNGNAEMPRLEAANNRNASTYNSFFLKKTNYLRLKNAQLGYTFSKDIRDKLRITKLRLYVSGSNLLTFSSLYQGLDPEGKSDRINDFPPLKIVNFGVNIIF